MISKKMLLFVSIFSFVSTQATTEVYFSNDTNFQVKVFKELDKTTNSVTIQSHDLDPHAKKYEIESLERKFKWGSAISKNSVSISYYVSVFFEDNWLIVGKINQVVRFHKMLGSDLGFSLSTAKTPFKKESVSETYIFNEFKESHYSEKNSISDTTQLTSKDGTSIMLELSGSKKSGSFLSNDDIYYTLRQK